MLGTKKTDPVGGECVFGISRMITRPWMLGLTEGLKKGKVVGFCKRFPFDRARSYHRVLLIKRVPENTEHVRSCRSPFTVLLHFVMRSTSTDETVASKMFRKEQSRVPVKHSQ